MVPPGQKCRDDRQSQRSGANVAADLQRHAGSGPSGSHQIPANTIRPFPTRIFVIHVRPFIQPTVAKLPIIHRRAQQSFIRD